MPSCRRRHALAELAGTLVLLSGDVPLLSADTVDAARLDASRGRRIRDRADGDRAAADRVRTHRP